MKIEIDRRDVCALMLACTCCDLAADGNTKWQDLHDKLEYQLRKYDEKHTKE